LENLDWRNAMNNKELKEWKRWAEEYEADRTDKKVDISEKFSKSVGNNNIDNDDNEVKNEHNNR
tara:strand:+ start:8226 stop:8417 length:192 start_codon:yes stop_codon:yes gene_type:complete